MENYLKNNEAVLKELKQNRIKKTNDFITDGIVDPETWFESKGERILFLLKEAYSSEGPVEWDLPSWLRSKRCMEKCKNDCSKCWPSGTTYNHVAEAVYMILNPDLGFDEWFGLESRKSREYKLTRKSLLEKIAVINIKKYDGKKKSEDEDLKKHIKEHGELLKKQIESINPTVIICGGTYSYLKELYDLEDLDNEFNGGTMLGDIKVIAAYHPSKQMSSKDKAEMIFEQYMKLRDR